MKYETQSWLKCYDAKNWFEVDIKSDFIPRLYHNNAKFDIP